MTKKLSEQIHQYFDLMEQIRSQLFRVVDISERYYCITSFSTSLQAMQCALVSKASLMEVKLIEGLTGKELMAFGAIHDALEQWSASGMTGDFPISQDQNVFAAYKSLTREEEADAPDTNEDELEELRTSILCADKAWLMQSYADEGLGTKGQAYDMDVGQLQDALCEHFGFNPDVDVRVVDVVGEMVKRFTDMPNHEALKEADLLTKEEMLSLADVWGLEKTAHEHSMRSLIKGYILRRT